MNSIKVILQYRGLIKASIDKEFRGKYSASSLGFLWNIVGPLIMILVYTVIFSHMLSRGGNGIESVSKYDYGIRICSGLIYWLLFTDCLNRCTNIFIDNANYLKKINFPKICILISSMMCSSIYFMINLLILLSVLFFVDFDFTFRIFELIPMALITLLLGSSIGLVLGIINVFVRDVAPFLKSILQLWFWATPIVYPLSIIPESFRSLYDLNPMVSIVKNVHVMVLTKNNIIFSDLAFVFLLILSMLVLGFYLYKRNAKEIMDEL